MSDDIPPLMDEELAHMKPLKDEMPELVLHPEAVRAAEAILAPSWDDATKEWCTRIVDCAIRAAVEAERKRCVELALEGHHNMLARKIEEGHD